VRPEPAGADQAGQPPDAGPSARQREHDGGDDDQAAPEAEDRGSDAGAGPGAELMRELAVDLRLDGDDPAGDQHHRNGGDPHRA
jgi:hypothetical protein